MGRVWGIRYTEPGTDRGGLILIKKEKPETSKVVGPNKELLGEGLIAQTVKIPGTARPTTVFSNKSTELSFPTLLPSVVKKEGVVPGSSMWKVINASFQVLNQTNPEITEGCWLCVSVKPPYYEAIGDMGRSEYSNELNPSKCSWGQEIGIALTQVT